MARSPYLYFEPDRLAKFTNLNLLARQVVEGFISGLHRSPHHGFSVEFSEHREYSPGDDLWDRLLVIVIALLVVEAVVANRFRRGAEPVQAHLKCVPDNVVPHTGEIDNWQLTIDNSSSHGRHVHSAAG